MKIAIVAWGYSPTPPLSNSIYTLMYEYRIFLNKLGHEVSFIDEIDVDKALDNINNSDFDFVHLHAYNFVGDFNRKLKQKYCFTCHYGYLLKEHRWDEDFQQVYKTYIDVPGIITPSHETKDFFIDKAYSKFIRVQPNGIDTNKINFKETGNHKAVCLGWIQPRKQQRLLAEIIDGKLSLDFVGPLDDPDFTEGTTTKYLGIWSLQQVYTNLTDYSCLVLISDGEVAPLVVVEALAAGLCVVVSESASANLHAKAFIKVLPDNILTNANPENKIIVTEAIIEMIEKNKYYRKEIVEYAKENFDFSHLIKNYIQIIEDFTNFY
jgi:glycosyltransferase involved in cell wall biosynthesis